MISGPPSSARATRLNSRSASRHAWTKCSGTWPAPVTGPHLGKLSDREHESGSGLDRGRGVRDQADFGSVPDDLGARLPAVGVRLAGDRRRLEYQHIRAQYRRPPLPASGDEGGVRRAPLPYRHRAVLMLPGSALHPRVEQRTQHHTHQRASHRKECEDHLSHESRVTETVNSPTKIATKLAHRRGMDRHATNRQLKHLAATAGIRMPRMNPHMLATHLRSDHARWRRNPSMCERRAATAVPDTGRPSPGPRSRPEHRLADRLPTHRVAPPYREIASTGHDHRAAVGQAHPPRR